MYSDKEHEAFYISALQKSGAENDPYRKALFYLLGLAVDTRNNIQDLYDFDSNTIIPDGLYAPWQTGTSLRVCRLAFNLYNGYCEDSASNFTPYTLFDTEYRAYMWIAVRLRFESGFQSPERMF